MSSPRITSSMISRGVLADLNEIATRVSRTQLKLSSGKEILRPSDDPFATGRALALRSEVDGIEQYQRNAAEGAAWTAASDSALGTIGEVLTRARELLLRAGNDTTAQSERNTIAGEIDQLIAAAKDDANATHAGRPLFSGTATTVRPYATGSDAYLGDGGDIVRSIGPGVSLVVNVRASDILGNGADGRALQTLRDMATHLRGGTPADGAALRGSDLVAIDRAITTVLDKRAEIGATANRLAAAGARLAELEENARGLLSKTEDADMAATIVDYSMQQSVYQSALKAGAGIVQTSLLDFLR